VDQIEDAAKSIGLHVHKEVFKDVVTLWIIGDISNSDAALFRLTVKPPDFQS